MSIFSVSFWMKGVACQKVSTYQIYQLAVKADWYICNRCLLSEISVNIHYSAHINRHFAARIFQIFHLYSNAPTIHIIFQDVELRKPLLSGDFATRGDLDHNGCIGSQQIEVYCRHDTINTQLHLGCCRNIAVFLLYLFWATNWGAAVLPDTFYHHLEDWI